MRRRICLLTATLVEFRLASSLLDSPITASEDGIDLARGRSVTLLRTEIGAPAFSEKFRAHLSRQSYDGVLIAGFGGALDPGLSLGDAIIYDRCISARDGRSLACDAAWSRELMERLSERLSERPGSRRGTGLTVDRVIDEAEEKGRLYRRWSAAAVDMESFELLEICAQYGVPAAVLRVISDEAGVDLPDFNRALCADGKIDARRLPGVLLARPRASWRFLASLGVVKESFKAALEMALSDER